MYDELFERLSHSEFRSRFHLREKEYLYVKYKGTDVIRSHAEDFIRKRLAPAVILNDGKQTPMRNHPVFIAQHATATCCRGCLYKWHHIPAGRELTKDEQEYIVGVIMEWISREIKNRKISAHAENDQ
jgi:exodeoxyribonuclease V alpha subunit